MTRLFLFLAMTLICQAQYVPPGGSGGGAPSGSAGGSLTGTYPDPTLATLAQDLKFTDATYDIGKTGATRPRDIFLSRDLTVGRNATIGTTFSIDGTGGTVTGTGAWNAAKIGLTYGGTNADLSATGGTSQFLKQASSGAAITVARPACADLSNASAACSSLTSLALITPDIGAATGTSLALTGALTTGSGSGVAGTVNLLQGTAASIVANTISEYAPASVTGYKIVRPGAAASGLMLWSNSSNTVTESIPSDLGYIPGTLSVDHPSANATLGLGITSSAPNRWSILYDRAGTYTGSQGLSIHSDASGGTSTPLVCSYTSPSICTMQWMNWAGTSRVATQFDATTTTLANVTGLTATVVAGRKYSFTVTLPVTADATGGTKFAIGGTATATAIWYDCEIKDLTTGLTSFGGGRQTALAGACTLAGNTNTAFEVVIRGTITVNAAGTITAQFAENSASGTSSVLVGGSMILQDIV